MSEDRIRPLDRGASNQLIEFSERVNAMMDEYPDLVTICTILEHSTGNIINGIIGKADTTDIACIGISSIDYIESLVDTDKEECECPICQSKRRSSSVKVPMNLSYQTH